jgi:hypothetical protein
VGRIPLERYDPRGIWGSRTSEIHCIGTVRAIPRFQAGEAVGAPYKEGGKRLVALKKE